MIAVLEAGGRADQDLLYVEISRASEGFELVVDDRELLAERLAERPGIDEGALEAIGADLASPVVDPDLFAGLQADWRSLRRRADRGRQSLVPGRRLRRGSGADRRAWRDRGPACRHAGVRGYCAGGTHRASTARRQNPRPGRKPRQPLAAMAGTLLEGVVARRGAGDAR